MKAPLIKGERYLLRPFSQTDAELWQVWDTDPEVQAYMPEPVERPQPLSEQYAYIKACEVDSDGYYWSIDTVDGVTIGTISLTEIDPYHHIADLGIMIGDKNYWGKGAATEVVGMLSSYAFAQLDIVRINAEVEIENVAMCKALVHNGFVEDGLFKAARVKQNARVDVKHFGIVRRQVVL